MIEKIITHPGILHADDATATEIVRMAFSSYNIPIERKNPTQEELDSPNVIVLDVGGQYCPSKYNFDHHQWRWKKGEGKFHANGVPMATAGLAWKYFGYAVIEALKPGSFCSGIADRVEEQMMAAIDAADCGAGSGINTSMPSFSFSKMIAGLNPAHTGASEGDFDDAFKTARRIANTVITSQIVQAKAWADAKEIVCGCPYDLAEDGKILVLDQYVPWEDHIYSREGQEKILFVVFPSIRGGWNAQQVPVTAGSFEGRKSFPKEWWGLRDEEFQAHVNGGTFCHNTGFIAGAKTCAATISMAIEAARL